VQDAVRLTIVNGWNDSHIKDYAKIIERIDPDFVEVKAYMWIGFSRYRLGQEAMPRHNEIADFSHKLKVEIDTYTRTRMNGAGFRFSRKNSYL